MVTSMIKKYWKTREYSQLQSTNTKVRNMSQLAILRRMWTISLGKKAQVGTPRTYDNDLNLSSRTNETLWLIKEEETGYRCL